MQFLQAITYFEVLQEPALGPTFSSFFSDFFIAFYNKDFAGYADRNTIKIQEHW